LDEVRTVKALACTTFFSATSMPLMLRHTIYEIDNKCAYDGSITNPKL